MSLLGTKLSLNYNFSNGLVFSLNNTYTEDPIDNNVLSISLEKMVRPAGLLYRKRLG